MTSARILRICMTGLYRNLFLEKMRSKEMLNQNYENVLKKLRLNGYLYPANFKNEMEKLRYEVFEIVPDFQPLQELWVNEFASAKPFKSGTDIILEQIRQIHPDIIYLQDLDTIPFTIRKNIKNIFPFVKIVTGFKGYPPANFNQYSNLDFIFSSYPAYFKQWNNAGIKTNYLPHCYDREMENCNDLYVQKIFDFVFIGSSGYGLRGHQGRYEDLSRLLGETPLEIWGLEQNVRKNREIIISNIEKILSLLPQNLLTSATHILSSWKNQAPYFLLRDTLAIKNNQLEAFPWYLGNKSLASLYPSRNHPPVFGNDYHTLIKGTKIVLNRHTNHQGEGGNIRCFEVTGAGSCLLTDTRDNLSNLFDTDTEIVTYNNINECKEKFRYLIENNAERQKIAENGNKRVLKEHLTKHRCQRIDKVLREY